MEKGGQVVVGVNKFQISGEVAPELLRVNESLGALRRTEVAAMRAKRDQKAVDARLAALTAGAKGTENLMPLIIAAVKAEATVGEVSDAMRGVFGEYQERLVL